MSGKLLPYYGRSGKATDTDVATMQAKADLILEEVQKTETPAKPLHKNAQPRLKKLIEEIKADPVKLAAAGINYDDNRAMVERIEGKSRGA